LHLFPILTVRQAVGGQALPQLMRDNVDEELLVATLNAISLLAR
jgi:hypothetical protein